MRKFLLPLAFLFSLQVFAANCALIEVQMIAAKINSSKLLKDLSSNELKRVDAFIPRKEVKWRFGDSSGEILLVDVKAAGVTSCVLYIKDKGVYRSLGGNDYCGWRKSPKLVWKDEFAWIEFPATAIGKGNVPVAMRELTINFDKASGSICILGLPVVGFDSLRCADDEAPVSK